MGGNFISALCLGELDEPWLLLTSGGCACVCVICGHECSVLGSQKSVLESPGAIFTDSYDLLYAGAGNHT